MTVPVPVPAVQGAVLVAAGASLGGVSTDVLIAFAAAVLGYLGQLVIRRQTKDKLISEASNEVAEGAKTLLAEYRQDLMESRAELKELRDRVSKLEKELELASEDRRELQRRLTEALERRAQAETRERMLEDRIKQIEGVVERRESRQPRASSLGDEPAD